MTGQCSIIHERKRERNYEKRAPDCRDERSFATLRSVRTDVLEVAYFEAGDGEVVLLLHGFPYDIHSYVDVIPRLVEAGHRVIIPYLRGHGPTRFLDSATPRSGQQAAIGADSDILNSVAPYIGTCYNLR